MNVKTALLNERLKEEIYIKQPNDFRDQSQIG